MALPNWLASYNTFLCGNYLECSVHIVSSSGKFIFPSKLVSSHFAFFTNFPLELPTYCCINLTRASVLTPFPDLSMTAFHHYVPSHYAQQRGIILHAECIGNTVTMFMKFLRFLMVKISHGLLDYIKHIFLHLLNISRSLFFKWCIALIFLS